MGSWPCVDDVQDKHDDEDLFCPHAGDCLDSLDTFLLVAGLGVWFLVVSLMVGVDLVLFHVGGISVWLRDKARCRRMGDLRRHFELLLGFVCQRKGSLALNSNYSETRGLSIVAQDACEGRKGVLLHMATTGVH